MTTKINTLLFIADPVESHSTSNLTEATFEKAESKYLNGMLSSLNAIHSKVVHLTEPEQISEFKNNHPFVISIWSGVNSKFRKALVPSVCEAMSIPYLGANPYISIVCQDKEWSKNFAGKFGIQSAKGALVSLDQHIEFLPSLKLPLVVKPNLEGGSIGIDESSLVNSIEDAKTKAMHIIKTYNQPALIEEFLPGREISFVLAGGKNKETFFEAVELYFDNDPDFFNSNIYDVNKKKIKRSNLKCAHRLITNEISDELKQKILLLYSAMQKCEILRIDGKFHNGDFKLIELTPDIHLGEGATFNAAFRLKGWTHQQMLKYLIDLRKVD